MWMRLLLAVLPAFISVSSGAQFQNCDISDAKMPLPSGQNTIVSPTKGPSFVGLAIGVQNYTCSNTSTYTNVGAVAELLDLSCLYKSPMFESAPSLALDVWKSVPDSVTAQDVISFFRSTPLNALEVLGQHYYVASGAGVSPKWDFTSSGKYNGDEQAFVIAAKLGSIASPLGNATNIDWVSLNRTTGSLADQVFRIETYGGQPATSCSPGSTASVKYTAQYWFYGGSIKK